MTEHRQNEGQQPPEGLGTHPRGPSFESPVRQSGARGLGGGPIPRAGNQPSDTPPGPPKPPPNYERQFEPPKGSKGPLIITIMVLVVVALVVGTASMVAHLQDLNQARPAHTPSAATQPSVATPSGSSIAFSSPEGNGRLTVLKHEWTTAGDQPPATGTYLVLEIKLESTDGYVSCDPSYFQLFDAHGGLTDSTTEGAPDPVLPSTTLRQDDQAIGFIAFDVARNDVTLVLTSRRAPITALKIPG